mgnify:CR=1 FL=1
MKLRHGFVSNSSSSSFTCGVCGRTESGYDAGPEDFDMSRCEAGHKYCNHHAPKVKISLAEKRAMMVASFEDNASYQKKYQDAPEDADRDQ